MQRIPGSISHDTTVSGAFKPAEEDSRFPPATKSSMVSVISVQSVNTSATDGIARAARRYIAFHRTLVEFL